MNRDEFQTMWAMLIGVWPKLDTPETLAAWWGLVGHYPAHHATASVRKYATDRRTAPSPSDIIEGIKIQVREVQRTKPQRQVGWFCDECENTGFVWTAFTGHGTVRRCGRGCMPPDGTDRLDVHDEPSDGRVWAERFREVREERARDRGALGETAYLRKCGYDPTVYRLSHGMIVRRSTT